MSKRYKHIFFDLDHTLWDFETNSNHTLKELVSKYEIDKVNGFIFEECIQRFHEANHMLWDLFVKDEINSEELRHRRFDHSFELYEFDKDAIRSCFNEEYLALCPCKGHLMPQAKEILTDLYGSYYNLYILTNGFEHVQLTKMITSQIFHYFEDVFTVKDVGFKKPDPQYFKEVLGRVHASPSECIMIGDSLEVDVLAAMQVGIDGVWYNPKKVASTFKPTFEIAALLDLKNIIS